MLGAPSRCASMPRWLKAERAASEAGQVAYMRHQPQSQPSRGRCHGPHTESRNAHRARFRRGRFRRTRFRRTRCRRGCS
eukprot:105405-Pleurochrysis_carterae.AAC.1